MSVSRRSALATISMAAVGIVIAVAFAAAEPARPGHGGAAVPTEQASLSVAVTTLQPAVFPIRVPANGNIMAWQEASIGAEINGLRLTEVKVNAGDTVRRGQPLATFAAETVEAELTQRRAARAEADAVLAEAGANARRARVLQESGALSAQQIQQYLTAEHAARARREAAAALERMQRLRLTQTRVVAPDDGIISARAAAVGAVVPVGQELFRLIRGGRLEWRAEVASANLAGLRPGQKVRLSLPGGEIVEGRLRKLGPVIDVQTRNGLVYVDLPPSRTARQGLFARGEFEIGSNQVMTLPQRAVLLRDGFSYVLRVGPDSRIIQSRVTPGRRSGDRVEIIAGLNETDRIVASGAAFLGDGDLVRVVEEPAVAVPAAGLAVPGGTSTARTPEAP